MEGRAELEEILAAGLAERFGPGTQFAQIDAEPEYDVSTHPIERLWVTLCSGAKIPIIFKRPGMMVSGVDNEEYKGSEREILIYRELLRGGRFGAPYMYGSAFEPSSDRCWLLLEDVGFESLHEASDETWMAAAQWLGHLHAVYLGREAELREIGILAEHDADFYRLVAAKARAYLEAAGEDALQRYDGYLERFDDVIAYLAAQPRTFVHGDIFPFNLRVQDETTIRPIDWEAAAIGLPAWDLVRLLDGWEYPQESDMYAEYLKILGGLSGTAVDLPEFNRVFKRCQLVNILWHLRWDPVGCQDADFVHEMLDEMERLVCEIGES